MKHICYNNTCVVLLIDVLVVCDTVSKNISSKFSFFLMKPESVIYMRMVSGDMFDSSRFFI